MADEWAIYPTRGNNGLAWVRVNLSLWKQAPNPRMNVLGWVIVQMNSPKPDGLRSAEEAPKLFALEDHLVGQVGLERAEFVGTILSAGCLELYFYMPHRGQFGKAVEDAMRTFPDYRFEAHSRVESEWSQYLDLMYPSPRERNSIFNRDTLTTLAQNGDQHHVPREVDHFAYFLSKETQAEFAKWASERGFKVKLVGARSGKAFSRGVQFTRRDPVDSDSIDTTTFEIREVAAGLQGDYDGWGCPVIRDNAPGPKQKGWLQEMLTKS